MRILVGTRKGLFFLERAHDGWHLAETGFLGDPVTMALADPRGGALYAALNLGHFGVKLHRSMNRGANWQELSGPAFPAQPTADGDAPSVELIWALEAAGADAPGVLWAGTIPGGLFRSDDGGDNWDLNQPLWNLDARAAWFGGGYDQPGIHSIAVDPRDSRRLTVAVSCGGVWHSEDGGGSRWQLFSAHLPPIYCVRFC